MENRLRRLYDGDDGVFLVMWLIANSSPQQRHRIAEYFQMPLKVALSQGNQSSLSDSVIPGGGDDLVKKEGEVNRSRPRDGESDKDIRRLKRRANGWKA